MDPDRVSVVYDIKRKLRKGHSEDIFKQFLTLGGYSSAAAIITFLLHLGMARFLGPEAYASYGTYVAILFTAFFGLTSIHLVITRFITYHRSRYQYEQINYIITHALKILFATGFVLFLILLFLADNISRFFHLESIAPTVILGFVLWFTLLIPVFEGAFKGLEDFHSLGKLRIIEASLRFVIAIFLVWAGFEVSGALFGLGLGTLFGLAFTYKHIYRLQQLKLVRPDMKQIMRFAIPVVLTAGSLALLLNMDLILVKHFFDPVDAGIFAAGSLVAKIPFLISMVFVGVMFPKITQLHVDGKNSAPVLKHALQVVVPIAAVFTLLSFFFSEAIFSFLFGPEYVIGPILGFYVFGMGLLAVTVILSIYLLGVEKENVSFALPLFVLGYTALLVWLHSSLLQVMIVVMLSMVVITSYVIYKARNILEFDFFL